VPLKVLVIILCIGFGFTVSPAQLGVAIQADPSIRQNPISANALADFTALLDAACHCIDVKAGSPAISITIAAPDAKLNGQNFAAGRNYPYFHYPAHGFTWTKSSLLTQTHTESLTLTAPSPQGIANGLYALLQEKLGFKFVHARQTIIPDLNQWPKILFAPTHPASWSGRPRFDKKGFHLHTMHPLELTEALHDPAFPGGLEMVQEYILWLARNGQNYFEFSLMEGVDQDLDRWVAHASKFTSYAHDRGILCGLDLSIHMIQQKSYQLAKFPPGDFRDYETQIRSRIRRLMHADWDFINLEFALAEFVGGLEKLRNRLRDAVIAEMAHYPQTKLIGRQHVVKPEDEMGGSHGAQSLNIPSDPRMGILVHTVMCYALTDSHAPVYELENFGHLLRMLEEQNQLRETWFYPESAYWVTFDNSIPLLLLPYLNARYKDIQTCEALGIPGHVTFSSGWEWGYWLVDWSIARWSWDYEMRAEKGKPMLSQLSSPYQYLREIFPNHEAADLVVTIAELQQAWLIEGNLLRWLCPSNPTDELPAPMNKQFQPRGFVNLGDLRDLAEKHPERLIELPIDSLHRYTTLCMKKATTLQISATNDPWNYPLQRFLALELIDALRMTALRAQHSARLMEAAQAYAASHQSMGALRIGISEAAHSTAAALKIVKMQERRYRYPIALLASRYHSHTSYDFGYLYTVHDLHFWEREEQQNLKGRRGPFFWNIYELGKIAGVRN
jgi:hypothetical protein